MIRRPPRSTLSLHDALPIYHREHGGAQTGRVRGHAPVPQPLRQGLGPGADRKSTRLNSSHGYISYAVFCLKKKKESSVRGVIDQGQSTATTLSLDLSLANAT